ncbi:MAG: type II toxin-antitoxin system VapC family toxin [Anaerolineales bacterium]|nr:type II toxin-antitoxin system VapC family toxin [Anaerolineales bacterium]
MNLHYLLDTNIISEPLKPKPSLDILRKLREHQGEIAIASVVWHELHYGCLRLPYSDKRSAIEAYLFKVIAPSMDILPYDERAATWHAAERARLTELGMVPPFVDGQIAAIAAVNKLVLVTYNTSDFENFQGITIEDWLEGTQRS